MSALESTIQRMAAEGWSKFERLPEATRAQLEERNRVKREQASDVARIFVSPEGQRVISMLVRQVLLAPFVLPVGGQWTAEQQAIHAAFRDGQNSVVIMLLNAIETAAGGDPAIKRGDGQ